MVALERRDGFGELTRHLGDLRRLLRRQIVDVLVDGIARIDAVADAVETRHEHGREGEIGIAGGIRAAEFHPLGLRAFRIHGNAAGGRAVAHGPGEIDRRLEAGNETTVGVRRRGGEGEDRRRVPQQPADVPARDVGEPGIAALTGECRLSVLPDRLVDMHARAVVAIERLGHEGGGETALAGDVLHHILVHHEIVRHAQQGCETHVDLALPRGRHLVVMAFHGNAEELHHPHHLAAHVLQRVRGGHREVALLGTDLVAEVRRLLGARVPVALDRIDLVEAVVRVLAVADVVEDEELRLGPEVGGIADAARAQIGLGLLGDAPRIAAVEFLGDRILDVTDHDEGAVLAEGIEERRRRIRHEQHVRFLDLLEAADRGSVEAESLGDRLLIERARGKGGMLPHPGHIREAQIDDLDFMLPDRPHDVGRCLAVELHGGSLLTTGRRASSRAELLCKGI